MFVCLLTVGSDVLVADQLQFIGYIILHDLSAATKVPISICWCLKGRFHEATNHVDERQRQKKLDLISRPTDVVWSFHGTVVIYVSLADQLNLFIVS